MPSKKINLVKTEPPSLIEPVLVIDAVDTGELNQLVEPIELLEVTSNQKGGKKKESLKKESLKKELKKKEVLEVSEVIKAPKKGGGKKKESTVEKDTEADDDIVVNGRKLRSFKVRLPNSEEYEGRFTGLTPYQAANKALSKFFRQNKDITTDITSEVEFSINETTRNSKKSIYQYIGTRNKLEIPVVYKITDSKDGSIREIVKNYKNSVKKVKKNDKL